MTSSAFDLKGCSVAGTLVSESLVQSGEAGGGGVTGAVQQPPHPRRFTGDVGQARQPSRCPVAQAAAPVCGQRLSWRGQVSCFLSHGAAGASFSGSLSALYFRGTNVSLLLACWYTKLTWNLRSLYSWLSSSGGGEEGERKATPLPSHCPSSLRAGCRLAPMSPRTIRSGGVGRVQAQRGSPTQRATSYSVQMPVRPESSSEEARGGPEAPAARRASATASASPGALTPDGPLPARAQLQCLPLGSSSATSSG